MKVRSRGKRSEKGRDTEIRTGDPAGPEANLTNRGIIDQREAGKSHQQHRDDLEMMDESTVRLREPSEMLCRGMPGRMDEGEGIRSEKGKLESLVRSDAFAVVTVDRQGRVLACNPGFKKLFGYEEEDLIGNLVEDFIAGANYRMECASLMRKTLRGEVFKESTRRRHKDGKDLDVEIIGVPVVVDGDIIGGYGVYREISEMKATERALRESEELFRTFAEDAPFGMSIMKSDRTFEYFNPKFTEIFGYGLEDLPDKETWFEKAYPDPKYQEMVRYIWTKDSIHEEEIGEVKPRVFTVRCGDGTDKVIHFRAVVVKDGKQLLTYEDITAKSQAEEKLRQSEERYRKLYEESTRRETLYRSLVQSSADAVVIYDLEGKVQFLSPAFTQLFGWTMDELEGKPVPFVPDSEKEVTLAIIKDLLEHGTPCSGFESSRYTREGKTVQVAISASRYEDHEGKPAGMLVILRDISARKELEQQLSQAHKMEAIGTLAGGIAHDFNNILQAMSGYTQLLMMKKDREHPDYEKLAAIERSARRASELTERLLIFSRKVESRLRPVDLNHEIEQVVKLLERTIPKMIRINLNLAEELHIINADPVQLEQVAVNIAVNARDAMPEGGFLTFRTDNVFLDETFSRLYPNVKAGNYVLLEISDSGHGMDQETREHIYEPFFTTKATGAGTGLGLAMVYGIVKSHGGNITCISKPGYGTTFRIYFPMLKIYESYGTGQKAEEDMPGGTERILLVDDEESILDIGSDILERHGYKTTIARSGEEALDLIRRQKDQIDLIVLDLNMPGMGGFRSLKAILEIAPGMKIIVATGHSSNEEAKKTLEMGATRFIPKPYRLSHILKAVRETLDG